ncbi:carotenoid isomerooxygenase-like [Macrobrachium nipponense]|uniref:carotenoid isomerooxygenase-like n=1 Tax=Macrobrachium nipponense TaxID=159736 RepID=UPI0030C88D15
MSRLSNGRLGKDLGEVTPEDFANDGKPYHMWFRNCECETTVPVDGILSGTIPDWLSGRLTRNGPGLYTYGETKYKHLFDGFAYLHQFIIKGGRVTYQSRFLQSHDHKKNRLSNRIVVTQLGTVAHPDPCKTLLQRFMSLFEIDSTDNCSVNVVHMGDELYALTESAVMRRIDPSTLACIGGKTRVNDIVTVNTVTAHPHVEPNGTVYNMGSSFTNGSGPAYNIIKFPPPQMQEGRKVSSVEQASIVATIPCQWKLHPSYYHSFGMTEHYFVFVEMPLVVSIGKLIYNHVARETILEAFQWYPEEKTIFRVVDRSTGKLVSTRYTTEAFVIFHHTNAYEKDGHLVIDLAATSDGEIITKAMSENGLSKDSPILGTHRRFILPLDVESSPVDVNLVTLPGSKCRATKKANGVVEVEGHEISTQPFELQRINYKYNAREYRFAYGVGISNVNNTHDKLVKMDVETGQVRIWFERNKFVSEPIFVSAPGTNEEDGGVVLSSLLDQTDPKLVSLLVLDAQSWTEMGRVDFKAKGTVTPTFHGQFAGDGEEVHMY